VRVMTWNIKTGVGNDPNDPRGRVPSDLGRIAGVIRDVDPDVVALQEVDRNRDRTGYLDQPAILAEALGMHVRYAPNLIDEAGEYGVATLSRFPILRSQHDRFISADGWEPRGVLEIVVDIGGGADVSVLNTHFQIGFGHQVEDAGQQRLESAELLATRVRGLECPAILMGDFNTEPGSAELEPLSVMRDVWGMGRSGGDGATFPASPARTPVTRIDAIYTSAGIRVVSRDVVRTQVTDLASDHYPVVAELDLSRCATKEALRVVT
jgi:endonuclease/exonuclease/phosphatase family metal-dependent hydrolase